MRMENKAIFIILFIVAIGGIVVWRAAENGRIKEQSANSDYSKEMAESGNMKVAASFTDIDSSELSAMLQQKDFTLVDVHIPEQPHIPKTDSFIPFNEIAERAAKELPDKNAKIVLYCRSGSMSRTAAEELVRLGYTNVYNLAGGTIEWTAAGYPVENIKL